MTPARFPLRELLSAIVLLPGYRPRSYRRKYPICACGYAKAFHHARAGGTALLVPAVQPTACTAYAPEWAVTFGLRHHHVSMRRKLGQFHNRRKA